MESGKKTNIFFEQEDGSWCGFDPWDWADLLGEEVLKIEPNIQYEVWQPDTKAKNIFEYKCKSKVHRKLFPAKEILYKFPFGKRKILYSESILNTLEDYARNQFVLNLNSWRDGLTTIILERFKNDKNIKIIVSGHGGPDTPLEQIKITHNPLKYIPLIREHLFLKKLIPRIDKWTEQNNRIINILTKYSKREIVNLTMGIDFDFWKPVKDIKIKNSLRRKFNIKEDSFVIFSGSNFTQTKQIDKFIEVINKIYLEHNFNFVYILCGRGNAQYKEYLKSLGSNLIKNNKLIFINYLTGTELLNLYHISDLYAAMSKKEGASVAIMKAFATGIPVLSTDTGGTFDLMKKYNIPTIVRKYDYSDWYKKIIGILEDPNRKNFPIDIARNYYDWKNVAQKFIDKYDSLINR